MYLSFQAILLTSGGILLFLLTGYSVGIILTTCTDDVNARRVIWAKES